MCIYVKNLFILKRSLKILFTAFAYQSTWILFSRMRCFRVHCYNYLDTVYIGFEKSNLPIGEARPHRELRSSFAHLAQLMFLPTPVSVRTVYTSSIATVYRARCISVWHLGSATEHADAGFDPRFAAACFAYVTSSILLGISRHAGTSWNPNPGNFGYGAFVCRDFARYVSTSTKMCHVWNCEYRPLPLYTNILINVGAATSTMSDIVIL